MPRERPRERRLTGKDLIVWLKDNPPRPRPGRPASARALTSPVCFKEKTGTDFQVVPYRAVGPATIDLVAGQIDIMFDEASNSLPQYRKCDQAFAVTSPTRLASAPDIPTVDEAGLSGLYVSCWPGI